MCSLFRSITEPAGRAELRIGLHVKPATDDPLHATSCRHPLKHSRKPQFGTRRDACTAWKPRWAHEHFGPHKSLDVPGASAKQYPHKIGYKRSRRRFLQIPPHLRAALCVRPRRLSLGGDGPGGVRRDRRPRQRPRALGRGADDEATGRHEHGARRESGRRRRRRPGYPHRHDLQAGASMGFCSTKFEPGL